MFTLHLSLTLMLPCY